VASGVPTLHKRSIRNYVKSGLAVGLSLILYGCGRGSDPLPAESRTQAQQSDIAIVGNQPGITPFIASVQLLGGSVLQLASVGFTIAPEPNTVSQPVSVTWSTTALSSRGYFNGNSLNLPVFGLYQGYQNQVTFQLTFEDGSTQQLQYQIVTGPYADPTGVYLNPTIVKARAAGSTLGFNFFILKSSLESPVIVDTDGQVRWAVPFLTSVGTSSSGAISSYFGDGQFLTGNATAPVVTLFQLDGTQLTPPTNLPQPLLSSFTHNIDPGSHGLLAEFNGTDDLGGSFDDIVSEIAPFSGQPPFQTYDMADILTTYMLNNGDDASAFVRPGTDWFHLNASAYDPTDNTVIVSSRENFLIKLNYSTHDIVWILGDPTKYWYTFPSLRAKALTLAAGGDYPIGQHAVSITSDGYILVMNDGLGSVNEPTGEPAGLTRTYSEVSAYSVNAAAMTAQQVWKFDDGQSIFSPVCGSSYEAPGRGYLVDFATADNQARLVGLDSNLNVVFDFQYPSPSTCATAWNAIPVPFENLQIN
jgi:arylsulfate sulfotransferase